MEKKRKFETNGRSITIPLNYKGYSVIAFIGRTDEPDTYSVTYGITNSAYSANIVMTEDDSFVVHSEKDANWEVYRLTMDKFAEGYFKPYIDTYDFEMTAMNRGIELLDAERSVESV